MSSNNQLLLVSGESGTGKSTSLRNIRNQDKWLYLNCEVNKALPFKNSFKNVNITDPYQVHDILDKMAEKPDKYEGVIIDTVTYLMDNFESQYVLTAENKMSAWSDYQQFFKILMQEKVATLAKPVIILAHTRADYDEASMAMHTSVPIKGALKNNGIESYFSTVVSTKTLSLKDLEKYKNDLLHITEDDILLEYKHVFQTKKTKGTIHERIRSPIGLFSTEQTFVDNDAQMILDHLKNFYA